MKVVWIEGGGGGGLACKDGRFQPSKADDLGKP